MKQHFGIGSARASVGHLARLRQHLQQPTTQTTLVQAPKETRQSFAVELVTACAEANITPGQLEHLYPVLKKYLKDGLGGELQTPWYLFKKWLPEARKDVEERLKEDRADHQAHIASDAAQDRRGRSVLLTTNEFGAGHTQLIDVAFPENSVNNKEMNTQAQRIVQSVGGWDKVDSFHGDSVGYNLKFMRDNIREDNTPTLPLPDPCHRLDGILDQIIGQLLLSDLIPLLNVQFSKTNRSWREGWGRWNNKQKMYPSPGETRAWTGDARVAEWLLVHLNELINYVDHTYSRTNDPSTNFTKLFNFLDGYADLIELEVQWLVKFTAPIVKAIMNLQARNYATVHTIWPLYQLLEQRLSSGNLAYEFDNLVLLGDSSLLAMYKKLDNNDRLTAKKELAKAVQAGRAQLVKNWGKVKIKVVDGCWDLVFDKVGDCFEQRQMKFFAVAQLFDPRKRGQLQMPPTFDLFSSFVPWTFDEQYWTVLYEQLKEYLAADYPLPGPGEPFDLRFWWDSLPVHQLADLKSLATRVLDVPGGSAEVERAVSAYEAVVSSKRLRLKDESIGDYVFIYANSKKRKADSLKRMERENKKRARHYSEQTEQ